MEGIVEASRKPWNDEAATRRNHHDASRRLWHTVDGSMTVCRGHNGGTCPGLARAGRLEKVRDEALTTVAASCCRWKPLESSSRFHRRHLTNNTQTQAPRTATKCNQIDACQLNALPVSLFLSACEAPKEEFLLMKHVEGCLFRRQSHVRDGIIQASQSHPPHVSGLNPDGC